jgi:hypothetical protein
MKDGENGGDVARMEIRNTRKSLVGIVSDKRQPVTPGCTVCSLFNDATKRRQITERERTMNWKGCGRKRLWLTCRLTYYPDT